MLLWHSWPENREQCGKFRNLGVTVSGKAICRFPGPWESSMRTVLSCSSSNSILFHFRWHKRIAGHTSSKSWDSAIHSPVNGSGKAAGLGDSDVVDFSCNGLNSTLYVSYRVTRDLCRVYRHKIYTLEVMGYVVPLLEIVVLVVVNVLSLTHFHRFKWVQVWHSTSH